MKTSLLIFEMGSGDVKERIHYDRHFELDIGDVICDCEGRIFTVSSSKVRGKKQTITFEQRAPF
jgi:hypothetical protein